jgi:hypothetical protein
MKCNVDDEYIRNLRMALNGPKEGLWSDKNLMKKVDIFLIGDSLEKKVDGVVNEFVDRGKFNPNRIFKAKVLNTRNSTIGTQEIDLEGVSFRGMTGANKDKKPQDYYCAYKRLNQGVLLPNGEVSLCCQDFSLEYILGDLKTQSLDNLYNVIQNSPNERNHFISGTFFPCVKCEHYRSVDSSYTGHLSS